MEWFSLEWVNNYNLAFWDCREYHFRVIKGEKDKNLLKLVSCLMNVNCLKFERTLQASKTSRTNDLLFAGGIVLAPNIFRLLSSSTALLGSPLTGSVFSLLHSPSTPSCSFDNWTCCISICSIARQFFSIENFSPSQNIGTMKRTILGWKFYCKIMGN